MCCCLRFAAGRVMREGEVVGGGRGEDYGKCCFFREGFRGEDAKDIVSFHCIEVSRKLYGVVASILSHTLVAYLGEYLDHGCQTVLLIFPGILACSVRIISADVSISLTL